VPPVDRNVAQGGITVSSQAAESGAAAATKIRAPRRGELRRPAGTLYRGREGMWSWVLHRITGVAIFFFLLVHVLDTALIRVSPEAYNAVIGTYKNPIMALGEVALVGAVAYHAYNGLRIILVDMWSWATRHQRQLWWGVLGLWLVTMLGFAPRHLMLAFGGGN